MVSPKAFIDEISDLLYLPTVKKCHSAEVKMLQKDAY